MKRLPWSTLLPFIFGMVALSFVAATAFAQWRMADVDRAALDIADNASPSIERLAEARAEMRRLQLLLRDNLDQGSAAADVQAVEDARARMDGAINAYLLLPIFPGEKERWTEILRERDALSTAVARCLAEGERGDSAGAERVFQRDVSPAAEALGAAFTRDIEFNAQHSEALARQIRTLRVSSTLAAFALDFICGVITIVGAFALREAMRAHADLAERHRRIVEERANELEEFAGRIAHDILSPLGTVSFALQLCGRPGTEEQRTRVLERGTRALDRVKRLVDGLLGFARAAAKPEANARADVDATIGDLLPDLQAAAADVGIELEVKADVTSPVACSTGVLTSMIANLAGNAIKYIGEGPVRRIEIRARDEGNLVRVEVEDTGPGLPSGFEERAFEPYVRGGAAAQGGIGLGLATVKRMAEGHGGRVGVRSIPGQGCMFWFELPKAADPASTTYGVLAARAASTDYAKIESARSTGPTAAG